MFLNVLKQLKQIQEDYPELEEFVFLIGGKCVVKNYCYFDTFIYKSMYDSITYIEYKFGLPFYRYTQDIANFFITHGIYYIHCIPKYHTDNTPVFLVKIYNFKELAALKILKYYRRYRYNLYKKRRDPLKKELMEYCYHPSRITF
jgi:hypothetical protein